MGIDNLLYDDAKLLLYFVGSEIADCASTLYFMSIMDPLHEGALGARIFMNFIENPNEAIILHTATTVITYPLITYGINKLNLTSNPSDKLGNVLLGAYSTLKYVVTVWNFLLPTIVSNL